jgi:hypothetical protein
VDPGPVNYPVGVYGVDNMPWTFDMPSNTFHQRGDQTVLTAGQYVHAYYTGNYPGTIVVNNAGEQAAHGLWEAVVSNTNCFDPTMAATLAAGYLAQAVIVPTVVTFQTIKPGLRSGQTITIQSSARNLSGTFLITEIRTTNPQANVLLRTVKAISGTTYTNAYQTSWQNVYKGWSSGSSAPTPVTISSSGSSGGTGTSLQSYYLGGSALEALNPGTSYASASDGAVRVTINTSVRGTNAATVTCRLKALDAGVTATAQLYDTTNSLVVGTSAGVTSQTFATVTFPVTLTTGTAEYELQVKSSAVNEPVFCSGYLS